MSKAYGALAVIFVIIGVYYMGHSAGVDSCKATQADNEKKAAKKSKKQANEILSLKEELSNATGKTITIIRKIPDSTGCLSTPLSKLGLDGLL